MCLYPSLMLNKKYLPTKKNKGIVPKCYDERLKYVAVGCQQCEECRRKKKNEWQVRLQEEIKYNRGKFVTLTFSEDGLNKIIEYYAERKEGEIPDANTVATVAMKLFLERWRKKFGKSVHHWFITELGDEETERIHMHGILFTNESNKTIDKIWQYGNNYYGYSCNAKTVNYCIKYIMKVDEKHPKYKQKILCSKGIGSGYIKTFSAEQNKFNRHQGEERTNETYRLNNGAKQALPIYYRNKIYTEKQREILWQQKLDKGIRFIHGKKYEFKTNEDKLHYFKELDWYQTENERKGYKTSMTWDSKKYNARVEQLNKYKWEQSEILKHINQNINKMKMKKIQNATQLEFDWMKDRKYIDEKAELNKTQRDKNKKDWIRKNIIEKKLHI